ncbi:hypothetical protein ACFS2C_14445 [Prauserella oleivorans]|uniref:DUF600 family protein n=1 Tax=Prauserella oleivorans TaxID=1478153 RepID=A0ABW5WBT2_9PSEU
MPDHDASSLIQRVCDALAASAPEDWRAIRLTVWASVLTYQFHTTATMADGSTVDVGTPPLAETLVELRRLMYQPGRGTWFSAWFLVRRDGEPEAGFNYDRDPAWWPEVPPTLFARDLESFPRAEEHIPGWLRVKLAEAADAERERFPPDAGEQGAGRGG